MTHSVEEFVDFTFKYAGLDPEKYVEIDKRYFRPTEVEVLIADNSKAREKLGWQPRITFGDLAKIMLDADMRAAVDAVCERKFGPGGPFHPDTPGPWKDSLKVRSAAQVHDERFRECVALQAQYVYDTFGKFPGTVPSMFLIMYLQAHHIDLEFYDKFYKPGAYLKTHAMHMARWHPDE